MKQGRTVAVIGLGQIGGSLVLALRKAMPSLHITGIDVSRKRARLLAGALHTASTKIEAAQSADLIFVCLHFRETMDYLAKAPRGPLIVDVCSGKRKVVHLANRKRLRFIGGHPMAGNERPGEKGWDVDLFTNAPFFLCPSRYAAKRDVAEIRRLIRTLSAKPYLVNPAAHDRAVALTSHLPALLSRHYREFARFVPALFQGPGYRSFTRLSHTPPTLLQTFLDSNGDMIRDCLRRWKKSEIMPSGRQERRGK